MSSESASEPKAPRSASSAGIAVSGILCVLLGVYTVLLSILGILSGFIGDACGSYGPCHYSELDNAVQVGTDAPWAVTIIAVILAIVWGTRRRRLGWLFPLSAIVLDTAISVIAMYFAYAAADLPLGGPPS